MEQGEQLELVWSLLGHHILHEGWRDKKTKKKQKKKHSKKEESSLMGTGGAETREIPTQGTTAL